MTSIQRALLGAVAIFVLAFIGARFFVVDVLRNVRADEPPGIPSGDVIGGAALFASGAPSAAAASADNAGPPVESAPADLIQPNRVPQGQRFDAIRFVVPSQRQRMEATAKALHEAKNDDEKRMARESLRNLLVEIFAADMNAREKQAAEIEARLAKLRQQYQDRQNSRDAIIDLQLQVLEREAAGLGFPGDHGHAGSADNVPQPPFGFDGRLPGSPAPGPRVDNTVVRTTEAPLNRGERRTNRKGPPSILEWIKTHPTMVREMKERKHFIEFPGGKMFAYANVNFPNGPSWVQVVEWSSGEVLGSDQINEAIGPLELTDEGVATREGDGSVMLRIPLEMRPGPDGPVYEKPLDRAGVRKE